MNNPDKIILHHSATEDGLILKDFDSIKNYHVNVKCWNDIGYHFIIENYQKKPICLEGRKLYETGAHTIGQNEKSVGICIVGDYDKSIVPEDLLLELYKLIEKIYKHYDRYLPIFPHSDFKNKSCPGKNFPLTLVKKMSKEIWNKINDVEKFDFDGVVNVLFEKGLIDSPVYWKSHANSTFDPDYVKLAFKKISERINKK
jgi:hypothetical protein